MGLVMVALLMGHAYTQEGASTPPTTSNTAPATPSPTNPAATASNDLDPDQTVHERAGRCVEGSELACMALTRTGEDGKERRILVVRTGTSDDTGIYTICSPQEDEPADSPNVAVFSESTKTGIRITIDKNVIRVPLAIVTQHPPKEGEDGSDGRVDASAGTAKYLDNPPEGAKDRLSRCAVSATPQPADNTVYVSQGRTKLLGKQLTYDETDGMARIAGPITFDRENQKDPLSGTSDRIEINVDKEQTVLVGNVVLKSSGGRISKASRVEYDDKADSARLYGTPQQPAESTRGGEVVRVTSGYILYNLTENEVVIRRDAQGNIEGDFPDTPPPAPASNSKP